MTTIEVEIKGKTPLMQHRYLGEEVRVKKAGERPTKEQEVEQALYRRSDGTIYQLVGLGIRCRHTVGLNWTAFGIEHVGTSDAEILHDHRQMRASLRLTLWLMAHYGIELRNVIGHNESLMSPYHHELYKSWRCQTHSDWTHADMRVYRHKLMQLAKSRGVPVGPWPPTWVHPNC